jgi:hypothetical protein
MSVDLDVLEKERDDIIGFLNDAQFCPVCADRVTEADE